MRFNGAQIVCDWADVEGVMMMPPTVIKMNKRMVVINNVYRDRIVVYSSGTNRVPSYRKVYASVKQSIVGYEQLHTSNLHRSL